MATVEIHARQLGCCKITLEVRSDNTRAMALYRDLGFVSSEPAEAFFWTKPLGK